MSSVAPHIDAVIVLENGVEVGCPSYGRRRELALIRAVMQCHEKVPPRRESAESSGHVVIGHVFGQLILPEVDETYVAVSTSPFPTARPPSVVSGEGKREDADDADDFVSSSFGEGTWKR